MLKKLLKYEWRATSRVLLPLYGSVIVMALINRLFWALGGDSLHVGGEGGSFLISQLPTAIASFVYGGLIVASFVVTFVLLIQRFYKSLLGDEGYLMFTLPVTVTQHILSKTIVAFVMCVLSGVATLLSVLVLSADVDVWVGLRFFFAQVFQLIGEQPHVIGYAFEGFVLFVLMTFASILSIYLCIAIGHLAKRHRIASAIGAYFGLSIVGQIGMWILMRAGELTGLMRVFETMPNVGAIHLVMVLLILLCAAVCALYFFFTRFILVRRLNLE